MGVFCQGFVVRDRTKAVVYVLILNRILNSSQNKLIEFTLFISYDFKF